MNSMEQILKKETDSVNRALHGPCQLFFKVFGRHATLFAKLFLCFKRNHRQEINRTDSWWKTHTKNVSNMHSTHFNKYNHCRVILVTNPITIILTWTAEHCIHQSVVALTQKLKVKVFFFFKMGRSEFLPVQKHPVIRRILSSIYLLDSLGYRYITAVFNSP